MSDFYATAAHVVPETSSDERMHVLDDTCWCRPIIDTDAWQIRHNAAMSGAAMPDALRCSCGPHAIVFGESSPPAGGAS